MYTHKLWRPQAGSAHIAVILACIVIVGIFAAGYTVSKRQEKAPPAGLPNDATVHSVQASASSDSKANSQAQSGDVRWQETSDGGWTAIGGRPPVCPDPVFGYSPVDTSKASSILLPGQYRGGDYKAHGGFRFDDAASNALPVRLPFDAKLSGLVRYYQINPSTGKQELQYLLTFQNSCGVMIRFDHLATLTADLQKIAATTPQPALDDTRGLPLADWKLFRAGAVIATAIGSPDGSNNSVDFGVYDLRQRNQISSNATWAALHKDKRAQTYYGACWIGWLPKADAARASDLMAKLPFDAKGASDYCGNAPGGTTLKYNGGQPL